MLRRLCFFVLGLMLVVTAAPAFAGIDRGYFKAEGKQSWGDIFSWAFGGEDVGRAYALIVGISQYQGFKNLEQTIGDPERMRRFLLDDAGFDYVHVITDEKVTRDRLRTLIQDEFRKRVGPDDRFIFYWSGHGIPVNARSRQLGYLPLTGSAKNSIASMLAMRDVLSWTDIIDAKQALHVLDTCFSGLARLPETQAARRDLTVELLNKPARHLLTATTGAGQTIASREWAGGVFTDAFIAGARGEADRSGDGVVDMLELEGFVRDRVNAQRRFAEWPSEIKPKSYDLQDNKGEFFFITSAKKREMAKVDDNVAIEHGMPVVVIGPEAGPPTTPQCDANADRLFWETIKDKTEAAYFEAYLERVASGELCGWFKRLAELALESLRSARPDEDEAPAWPFDLPTAAGPPPIEASLPRERMIQIQERLAELGFDPGAIDGDFGPRTRAAVAAFQRSIGAPETGMITEDDEIALAEAYAIFGAQQPTAATSRGNDDSSYAPGSTFRDCPDCPEMVVIPSGSFMMGSPEDEEGRDTDEGPQHEVLIQRFALGRYEVTRGQFARYVETTGRKVRGCAYWDHDTGKSNWAGGLSWRYPGFKQTEGHPVTCVSWEDAQAYVDWLSKVAGERYRLPSESEWEYAARAGTTTRFFWGDNAGRGCTFANSHDVTSKRVNKFTWRPFFCDDKFAQTAPVGGFDANGFGLYDMIGNVSEWVEDLWRENHNGAPTNGSDWLEGNGSVRVLRGGSWYYGPRELRSANRYGFEPVYRDNGFGFRVARTLTP